MVLLYNLSQKKRMAIRPLLLRLGIAWREVSREEYGLPIGSLLGLDGISLNTPEEGFFHEEMLIMHQLSPAQFNGLLQGLRLARAPIALKAVVTETNQSWSSLRLWRELSAEHEAMNRLKQAESIHKQDGDQ